MNIQQEYQSKKRAILERLWEFKRVKNDDLFYEMCFCLLTPQSNAINADSCIRRLKQLDFLHNDVNQEEIKSILKGNIRFHNNKSRYLLELKDKYLWIKEKLNEIEDIRIKRDFLVINVLGLGLKEASHYLRNIGHENLAILDRHILKNLKKLRVISSAPKSLTRSNYMEIEKKFLDFARKSNIPMDHLDLLFWSQETGEIFK